MVMVQGALGPRIPAGARWPGHEILEVVRRGRIHVYRTKVRSGLPEALKWSPDGIVALKVVRASDEQACRLLKREDELASIGIDERWRKGLQRTAGVLPFRWMGEEFLGLIAEWCDSSWDRWTSEQLEGLGGRPDPADWMEHLDYRTLLVEALALLRDLSLTISKAHAGRIRFGGIRPGSVLLKNGTAGREIRLSGLGTWTTPGSADTEPDVVEAVIQRFRESGDRHLLVPPEMRIGGSGRIGPETDVYSVAALLYGLLVGKADHSGQPYPIGELGSLSEWLPDCLEEKPEHRPSMEKLAKQLEWFHTELASKVPSGKRGYDDLLRDRLQDDRQDWKEIQRLVRSGADPVTAVVRAAKRVRPGARSSPELEFLGWFLGDPHLVQKVRPESLLFLRALAAATDLGVVRLLLKVEPSPLAYIGEEVPPLLHGHPGHEKWKERAEEILDSISGLGLPREEEQSLKGRIVEALDEEGRTALDLAVGRNEGAAVDWLIDQGARVHDSRRSALAVAASVGAVEQVERLLQETGGEAEWATWRGKDGHDLLSLLLSKAVSEDVALACSMMKDTRLAISPRALHVAATVRGWPKVTKALVDRGASVGSQWSDGKTVLDSFISSGTSAECLEILLKAGATLQNRNEVRYLHALCRRRNPLLLGALLDAWYKGRGNFKTDRVREAGTSPLVTLLGRGCRTGDEVNDLLACLELLTTQTRSVDFFDKKSRGQLPLHSWLKTESQFGLLPVATEILSRMKPSRGKYPTEFQEAKQLVNGLQN